MEEKQHRQRCAFTAEYKAEVALCRSGGKPIGVIAGDLGITLPRRM